MDNAIRNVLVPIDFSEASLNAMQSAIRVCKRHTAHLHLLHVEESALATYKQYGHPQVTSIAADISLNNEVNLKTLANSVRNHHIIDCTSYNVSGLVTHTICEMASRLEVDLIVAGTNPSGKSGISIIDKIPYRILKHTSCPVLTIPNRRKIESFRNIVFPVRPVLNALDKYQFVRSIVRKNKSTVRVIGMLQKKSALQLNTINKLFDSIERSLEEDRVPFSSDILISNDISKGLLDAGKKFAADLFVITASTRHSFKQFFYGTYAQKMMNNHFAAVLCIKPKDNFKEELDIQYLYPNSDLG